MSPACQLLGDSLPKVLVVDDEPGMRAFVVDALECCTARARAVASASEALAAIESHDYDIVISDICMPGVPGLELLKVAEHAQWDLGVILMTGHPRIDDLVNCLRFRASDFLVKPFSVQQLTASVSHAYSVLKRTRHARVRAEQLGIAIESRTRELQNALRNMEESYSGCLAVLIAMLDAREHETYAHSFRVQAYASQLARIVGYSPAFLPQLETAALLHDIGKIAVPDRILLKPDRLTPEEFDQMKCHAEAGADILHRVGHLRPATDIVRHHHERYDGSGYPDGLAGENIPLGARIFTVADTLDAMTSDRCYRKALPYSVAHEEIVRCSGTQFDPTIVEAFRRVPESVWSQIRAETETRCENWPQ